MTTLPLLARVNGACMAGGMGLLCMADLAVAADHSLFGLPEVKLGVFPMQVLSLLQGIAPRRKVREWAFTGEPFGAAEALAAGLLNHVVPAAGLDAKLQWLLARLLDNSPTAIRLRGPDGGTMNGACAMGCFSAAPRQQMDMTR
jgi:methylglutaconyl-CoA hydratase